MVTLLLKRGASADFDAKNGLGKSPLRLAAEAGNNSAMKALLHHIKTNGYSVNMKEQDILYWAVTSCSLDVVESLISFLGSIDVSTHKGLTDGNTLLHAATHNKDVSMISWVLQQAPILVNRRNDSSRTPLHLVAETGNLDALRELSKSKDIEINVKDAMGRSALHLILSRIPPIKHLAGNSTEGYNMISYLMQQASIDIRTTDLGGSTLLHEAIKARDNWKWTSRIIVRLLDCCSCADVNVPDERGQTVLHRIMDWYRSYRDADEFSLRVVKDSRLVTRLLEKSANANLRDNEGNTALDIACGLGKDLSALIGIMLEANDLQLNAQRQDGWTALHHAAATGHFNHIKILLEHGAEPNLFTERPSVATAERLARSADRVEVADFIHGVFRSRKVDLEASPRTPKQEAVCQSSLVWNWPSLLGKGLRSAEDMIYDAPGRFVEYSTTARVNGVGAPEYRYHVPPDVKQWQLRVNASKKMGWDWMDTSRHAEHPERYQEALDRKRAKWIHFPANNVSALTSHATLFIC